MAKAGAECKRRRGVRWLRVVMPAVTLLLLVAALALGCTTRVYPPRHLADPVSVFLIDYGRTPSLVLPADGDGMVRYVYGDWRYYALADTGGFSGPAALLWPTPGTLGRGELPGAVTAETVEARAGPVEYIYTMQVERDKAASLRQALDGIFEQHADSRRYNPRYDLVFVHHDRKYTYFYNSNHMTADWLRQLGCEVRGPAFQSRWRVGARPAGRTGDGDQ